MQQGNKKKRYELRFDSQMYFTQGFRNMTDKCEFYRGKFIHQMTELEGFFDDIISIYFCPKEERKREELLYVLLSTEKMTLHGKYQLVSFIMHRYFQEFYDEHSPKPTKEQKNNPPKSLDNKVEDLIKLRNKFAHRRFNHEIGKAYDEGNLHLDTKVGRDGKIKPSELLLNDAVMVGYDGQIYKLKSIFHLLAHQIWKKEKAK